MKALFKKYSKQDLIFLLAESLKFSDFTPIPSDEASLLCEKYSKKYPFIKNKIILTSQTSSKYGFSVSNKTYYIVPLKFIPVTDSVPKHQEINEKYFDKIIKSDHLFGLFDNRTGNLNLIGYLCLNTITDAVLIKTKARSVRVVQIIEKIEEPSVLRLFGDFLMNHLNITSTGLAINPNKDLVDDSFYQFMMKNYDFEKEEKSNWIVRDFKKSNKPKIDIKTAAEDKKNVPDGGKRDWEQKSSKRRDGMPGGNQSTDYISKGDHGQAGLDILFKGIDKAADYAFDKEASKKYRI